MKLAEGLFRYSGENITKPKVKSPTTKAKKSKKDR